LILETFQDQIENIRREHPTASHIVYAYRIKTDSGSIFEKYNDAGEPSGTAGKPSLRLLQMKEIRNGVIFTVRYFGGIKLGKGGLVRAYTETAKLALENATISEYVIYQQVLLTVTYPLFEILEREMSNRGYKILKKDFSEQVTCTIQVRKEQIDSLRSYFSELRLQSYDIID
jgi:uncharacterized YigZ family protein